MPGAQGAVCIWIANFSKGNAQKLEPYGWVDEERKDEIQDSSYGKSARRRRIERRSENEGPSLGVSADTLGTAALKKSLRPRHIGIKSGSAKASAQLGSSSRYAYLKGHSRRQIFKRNPGQLSSPTPFVRLETRFFHRDVWLNLGDIVALNDIDGGTYYAQLRSIIIDRSENAFIVITWLIPTTEAQSDHFDPSCYIIGMEEETPRRINCCQFVCRCPSDYFKPINSPYTVQFWQNPDSNF